MSLRKSSLIGLAFAAALASAGQAQEPSNDQIAAGRGFALRVCAACHVVTRDPTEVPTLKPPAPSFPAIARRPSFSEASLRQFLGSNHRHIGPTSAMPNPQLVDYQIDEIVAYLLALKAGR
ncbi:MAG: c-type cytochrome [Hyphomicrobiales bacterium]